VIKKPTPDASGVRVFFWGETSPVASDAPVAAALSQSHHNPQPALERGQKPGTAIPT
jgi:hypothetical protein